MASLELASSKRKYISPGGLVADFLMGICRHTVGGEGGIGEKMNMKNPQLNQVGQCDGAV
jgi:hypothetical protein